MLGSRWPGRREVWASRIGYLYPPYQTMLRVVLIVLGTNEETVEFCREGGIHAMHKENGDVGWTTKSYIDHQIY